MPALSNKWPLLNNQPDSNPVMSAGDTSAQVVASDPTTSTTPTTPTYNTSDPLGSYFQNNQTAGDTWLQVKATLDQYGLSDLYPTVEQGIVQGWDAAQAYQHIRETPTYQSRFAGNAQRVANGLQPLSETQYLSNEAAYSAALSSSGVNHFNTQQDYANFIGNDVSPTELQDRLKNVYQVATNFDQTTKNELNRLYGVTDGDLVAYALDPKTTEQTLLNRFNSSQIAASANRTSWGDLSQAQAENLQQMGVSQSQADQGFNKLVSENQLMNALNPGEQNINAQTQLDAQFGQNALAQQQIVNQAQGRIAAFNNGGSFANNKEGFTGIGAAR